MLGALVFLLLLSGVGAFALMRVAVVQSRQDDLQAKYQRLQAQYRTLETLSEQRTQAVSTLASLANQVSAEYGISRPGSGDDIALDADDSQSPDAKQTIEQFNFLKAATYSRAYQRYAYAWQTHSQPSGWPVVGELRSPFGERTDPFSGEGAFHTGLDLQASTGTPVHVTADGVVVKTAFSGRYGNLVVVDHGNGFQTYYAHLSQFIVVPGEEVRLGQVIALSGGTGRVTSPHLHYEVRIKGVPVNPYRFLKPASEVAQTSKAKYTDFGF
jgi:murein DD-endopeptidase MepM/ murein hydrolase activator NlpD